MSMRTKTPSSRTGTESTIVLDPEEFEASRLGSGARSAGGERSELDERAQRAGGGGGGGAGGARRAVAAGDRRAELALELVDDAVNRARVRQAVGPLADGSRISD